MVFAVVEKAGTTVMMDGEELDSWSVIINGEVRIDIPGARNLGPKYLRCGDSFGITPTMDKLYHQGIMKTVEDDCQFVCITQVIKTNAQGNFTMSGVMFNDFVIKKIDYLKTVEDACVPWQIRIKNKAVLIITLI